MRFISAETPSGYLVEDSESSTVICKDIKKENALLIVSALNKNDTLLKERDKAISLLKVVCNPNVQEECYYDHHGLCQAHFLSQKPCPFEEALELVKKLDKKPPIRVVVTADPDISEEQFFDFIAGIKAKIEEAGGFLTIQED